MVSISIFLQEFFVLTGSSFLVFRPCLLPFLHCAVQTFRDRPVLLAFVALLHVVVGGPGVAVEAVTGDAPVVGADVVLWMNVVTMLSTMFVDELEQLLPFFGGQLVEDIGHGNQRERWGPPVVVAPHLQLRS